jgi:hypothetical protein
MFCDIHVDFFFARLITIVNLMRNDRIAGQSGLLAKAIPWFPITATSTKRSISSIDAYTVAPFLVSGG